MKFRGLARFAFFVYIWSTSWGQQQSYGCQTDLDCLPFYAPTCYVGRCSPTTYECYVTGNKPNGAPCASDSNACTADQCMEGVCEHTLIICDDDNDCTNDECDPQIGCVHSNKADMSPCNSDCNACTQDVCLSGQCNHLEIDCDNDNDCDKDYCDPAEGCKHLLLADGTRCRTDYNACTVDVCMAGSCTHPGILCDDNDPCTEDSCDVRHGCVHSAMLCADESQCTLDFCIPGLGCQNIQFPFATPGGDQCWTCTCDPESGELTDAVAMNCEDGDACTLDYCLNGVCYHDRHVPFVDNHCLVTTALCRTEECMVFICLDNSTGRHTWIPATVGLPCNITRNDSCTQYACDGAGYCRFDPSAPSCTVESSSSVPVMPPPPPSGKTCGNVGLIVGVSVAGAILLIGTIVIIVVIIVFTRREKRKYSYLR